MKEAIKIIVYGVPRPGGSKSSFVPINKKTGQPFRGKTGRVIVNTVDSNPRAKDWKASVAQAAREVYEGQLLTGPLAVSMQFFAPRPQNHYGSKKGERYLKPTAPPFPSKKPDALKLARSTEDALTKVVWLDDAQIVEECLFKRWGEPARAEIAITAL